MDSALTKYQNLVFYLSDNKGASLPNEEKSWKVTDRTVKLMEIRYVGTHENADYRRID
jgi:hypothetical protein